MIPQFSIIFDSVVNFFSHYFFDHSKSDSVYNFGLLTPDLLRNFTPSAFNKNLLTHSQLTEAWKNGIHQHINRDKLFHNSLFFQSVYSENRELALTTFKNANLPKFWFALHVLIEMILDKFLIQKNNQLLHNFYNELESVTPKIPNLLTEIEHKEIDIFLKRFEGFYTHQYLFKYQSHEGITYGLNRIYNQIKLSSVDWTAAQFTQLRVLTEKIELSIENHISLI